MAKPVVLALIAGYLTSSCATADNVDALAVHKPAKVPAVLTQPCSDPQPLPRKLSWGALFKIHQSDRAALRKCARSKQALVKAVQSMQQEKQQ